MAIDAAFIDMDGTLYRDGNPIEGAAEAVQWLREHGVRPLFFTNNATLHRETYVDRLADCGIAAERDEIITSGYLTACHLDETAPDERVYVVGEDGLRDELREQGIELVEELSGADTVVLSYTDRFDYELLTEVLRGFDDQRLVATNPDQTLPTDDGPLPGTGTIVAAIETMLGREAAVIGMPSLTAARTAAGIVGADLEDCLMVGDRLNTDIEMGDEAGMRTVLVLSGVTDQAVLAESTVEPDHVLGTIGELSDVLDQKL
jgi:HAD superfamily hydrolase (TIGR01450 family)